MVVKIQVAGDVGGVYVRVVGVVPRHDVRRSVTIFRSFNVLCNVFVSFGNFVVAAILFSPPGSSITEPNLVETTFNENNLKKFSIKNPSTTLLHIA